MNEKLRAVGKRLQESDIFWLIAGPLSVLATLMIIRTAWSMSTAVQAALGVGVHELGHALVMTRYRMRWRLILILVFGGVIPFDPLRFDEKTYNVTLAGPLANLCMMVLCISMSMVAPSQRSVWLETASVQAIFAGFNLLPWLVLDGKKLAVVTLLRIPYRIAAPISAVLSIGTGFFLLLAWRRGNVLSYGQVLGPLLFTGGVAITTRQVSCAKTMDRTMLIRYLVYIALFAIAFTMGLLILPKPVHLFSIAP